MAFLGLPGDPEGTLWTIWTTGQQLRGLLPPNHIPLLGFPEGHPASIPTSPTLFILGALAALGVGEELLYNGAILLSFPLAALTSWFLARAFGLARPTALLVAVIYALAPVHMAQSLQHLSLALVHLIPLVFFFLLRFQDTGRASQLVWAGVFFVWTMLDSPYWGYFTAISILLFVVALAIEQIIKRERVMLDKKRIARFVAVAIPFLAVLGLVFIPPLLRGEFSALARPIQELETWQARLYAYLLPPSYHPIFGNLFAEQARALLRGANFFEETLYLGVVPILLACAAVVFRWPHRRVIALTITLLLLLVISAVPSPLAPLLHSLNPFIRVYARLGLFVLLTLAILAGFGFESLLKRVPLKFLLPLILALVIVEFLPPAPIPKTALVAPEALEKLREAPGGAVVHYPFVSQDEVRATRFLTFQRFHRRAMANNPPLGSEAERRRANLLDPRREEVQHTLARLGVRYLIVHEDIFREGRLEAAIRPFYDPAYPRFTAPFLGGEPPKLGLPVLAQDNRTTIYLLPEVR